MTEAVAKDRDQESKERRGETKQSRPVGFVQPEFDDVRRASSLLDKVDHASTDDLDKARAAIFRLAESSLDRCAWKLLLSARLEFLSSIWAEAEACVLQAAGLFTLLTKSQKTLRSRALAAAYVLLGTIYRRQERLGDAETAHEAAWRLLSAHGSWEELWEIHVERGHDTMVVGDYGAALERYRHAAQAAEHAASERQLLLAKSNDFLTAAAARVGDRAVAVEHARIAHRLWREWDPASILVARAAFRLGSALLNLAEQEMQDDYDAARKFAAQAASHLQNAIESLRAFGGEALLDVQTCEERLEVAQRILATIGDA